MAINRAKYRAGPGAGYLDPAFERQDWAISGSAVGDADLSPRALLIGLTAAQMDDDALPDMLNIRMVEPDQLGAPEPASKAQE
jgi:hypothetical protein